MEKQEVVRRIPVTQRMPYDPENKTLSKEQFKSKMRAKREMEARLKAYAEEIKTEVAAAVESQETVTEPVKKIGRPKKVE